MRKRKPSLLKLLVLNLLVALADFRERRNKSRGIGYLIRKKYKSVEGVDRKVMEKIVDDILAMDRYWRKILQNEREDLRGKDYDGKGFKEKKQLEQEYQVGMEYEPGFNSMVKELQNI